jgi:hypothetical protein
MASQNAVSIEASSASRAARNTPLEPMQFGTPMGSLAYDLRLRSDSYDPQRPSVLQCRSTAPLHSRSVRGDEQMPIIYPDLRLDYKVATHPSQELQRYAAMSGSRSSTFLRSLRHRTRLCLPLCPCFAPTPQAGRAAGVILSPSCQH